MTDEQQQQQQQKYENDKKKNIKNDNNILVLLHTYELCVVFFLHKEIPNHFFINWISISIVFVCMLFPSIHMLLYIVYNRYFILFSCIFFLLNAYIESLGLVFIVEHDTNIVDKREQTKSRKKPNEIKWEQISKLCHEITSRWKYRISIFNCHLPSFGCCLRHGCCRCYIAHVELLMLLMLLLQPCCFNVM